MLYLLTVGWLMVQVFFVCCMSTMVTQKVRVAIGA